MATAKNPKRKANRNRKLEAWSKSNRRFMKSLRWLLLVVPAATLLGCQIKHGTKEEAKAMAIRAANYLKRQGPEKAFPAFSATNSRWSLTRSPWHDGDIYVFVYDRTGVLRASGIMQVFVGQNQLDIPDFTGKFPVREIVGIKDQGWVDYWYWSPVDGKGYEKTSYCVRVGDYIVGAGAYNYSIAATLRRYRRKLEPKPQPQPDAHH